MHFLHRQKRPTPEGFAPNASFCPSKRVPPRTPRHNYLHYLDLMLFNGEWTPQPGAKTLDFDMEPEGFVSISGRITDSVSGNGIPGASVGALFWEEDGFYDHTNSQTDSEGYFEFANLPAGQWQFYGAAPD